MKTVSVTEFRQHIKKYLEIAESERLVIHRNKGISFVITPLFQEKEETILNPEQKQAIEQAIEQVKRGQVLSHEEAMGTIKSKHSKYFK